MKKVLVLILLFGITYFLNANDFEKYKNHCDSGSMAEQ